MTGKLNEFLVSNFDNPLERIQAILTNNPGLTSVQEWTKYLMTNNTADDIADLHLEVTTKKFSFNIKGEEVSAIGFLNFVTAVYEYHNMPLDNNAMAFFESLVGALNNLNVLSQEILEIRRKVAQSVAFCQSVFTECESVRGKQYPGYDLDRIVKNELVNDYPNLYRVIKIFQEKRREKVYSKIAGSSNRTTSPVVKLEEFNRVAKEIFFKNIKDLTEKVHKDAPLMMGKVVKDRYHTDCSAEELFFNTLGNEEVFPKLPSFRVVS